MVHVQMRIHQREWDAQNSLGFRGTARRSDVVLIIKEIKKRTCRIVDFAVSVDKWEKTKSEKKDNYLDRATERRKLCNWSMTGILTVICAFGTVLKGVESGLEVLEIRGRDDTIQGLPWIPRRVLET